VFWSFGIDLEQYDLLHALVKLVFNA